MEAEASEDPIRLEAGPPERSPTDLVRNFVSRVGPWPIGLVIMTWTFLLPRMIPTTGSDRGIFISVAERLRAGDRLYIDVWDNKDPFFYYMLALGRQASPLVDIAIEVGWVLTACMAVFSIARYINFSLRLALLAGFMFAPLIITGAFYYAGYTHLPGIALTLVSIVLALRQRWFLAGVCLGLLLFFKLILLPIPVLALIVMILLRPRWRKLTWLVCGFVATFVLSLALIAVRGELPAYFDAMRQNAAYSNGSLLEPNAFPLLAHIHRTLSLGLVASLVVMTLALILVKVCSRPTKLPTPAFEVWCISWATIAGGLLVIAFTGLWDHHNQAIYPAALLVMIMLIYLVSQYVRNLAVIVTVGLLLSWLVSGLPQLNLYLNSLLYARGNITSLTSVSPESAALLKLGKGNVYARVGMNDDLGHAAGLGAWTLKCSRFHQYPHETSQILNSDLACLGGAKNLVISPAFQEISGEATWNTYVQAVEGMLKAQFTCESQNQIRVCLLKSQ